MVALWGCCSSLLSCGSASARAVVARGVTPPSAAWSSATADARARSAASSPRARRIKATVVGRVPLDAGRRRRRRASSARSLDDLEWIVDGARRPPRHRRAATARLRARCSTTIRTAKALGVQVSACCRACSRSSAPRSSSTTSTALTVLGVRRFGLSRSSRVVKRALDIVGAGARPARARAGHGRDRARDQAHSPGPVFFRQRRDRPRRARVRDPQVPHDGRRRRGAQGRAASSCNEARRPVQDRRRPAHHARRPVPAPHLARRAAAADQRAARRDEPRRPAPARRRRGRRIEGWHRRRLHLKPGHDRPLADLRLARGSRCARW